MRFVRMAVFIASFAMLVGGAMQSSMADSLNACSATTGATNTLALKLGSNAGLSNTCGGTKTASKQCCSTSVCNCVVNGAGWICQGGSNKNVPNPNSPCCLQTNTNNCYCQGTFVGKGAVCNTPS